MKIQILLFDGFDELDAIAPFEVLHAASLGGVDLRVEMVTPDDTREVVAQHGTRLHSGGVLRPASPPDVLIVPGGGWNARAERGAWAEYHKGELPALIYRVYEAGATVASVCTGAMLLARAGILAGRAATTHHQALAALQEGGVEVVRARVVDEGRIITAGGVTSGLDLALWILERYFGPLVAHAVEAGLEYERRGTVWRREGAG